MEQLSRPHTQEIMEILKAGNLDFHIEKYPGDHRVDKNQLKKIFKQYIEQ